MRLMHAFMADVSPNQITFQTLKSGFFSLPELSFTGIDFDSLTENQRQVIAEAHNLPSVIQVSAFLDNCR